MPDCQVSAGSDSQGHTCSEVLFTLRNHRQTCATQLCSFPASISVWPHAGPPSAAPSGPLTYPFQIPTDIAQTPSYPVQTQIRPQLKGALPSRPTIQQHQSKLGLHDFVEDLSYPLDMSQLHSCGGDGESAVILRHQFQLHMIDLMLARVTAAEEAIWRGTPANAQAILNPANLSDDAVSWSMPLGKPGIGPVEDVLHEVIAPLTSCPQTLSQMSGSASLGVEAFSLSHDLVSSNYAGYIYELVADNTTQQHYSGGNVDSCAESLVDCPGSCLMPHDWLTDDCDEANSTRVPVMSLGKPVQAALPLMPPSLIKNAAGNMLL